MKNEPSKSERLLARAQRSGDKVFTEKILLDLLYNRDKQMVEEEHENSGLKGRYSYDLNAGALLSQICWWFSPNDRGESRIRVFHEGHGWIANDDSDWWKDIRLSPKQVRGAMDSLRAHKHPSLHPDRALIVRKKFKFNGKLTPHVRLNDSVFCEWYEKAISEEIPENPYKDDKPYYAQQGGSEMPNRADQKCPTGHFYYAQQGISSNTQITSTDHLHRSAEEGSLHSPSNDDPSSANVRTEERSEKDPKVGKKNGKARTPPAGGGRARPEPKRKAREKKASPETAFLHQIHGEFCEQDPIYAEKDLKITGELEELAGRWLGLKDRHGCDMTDDNEQKRLAHWFCKTYKPGMSYEFTVKPTSLKWALNETTLTNFLSARKLLPGSRERKEDWKPLFRLGDPVRLKDDGRTGRVCGEGNVTGEMLFVVRLEDGTEIEGRKQDELEKIEDGRLAGAYIN